jgi:hypothetical protein
MLLTSTKEDQAHNLILSYHHAQALHREIL